MIEISISSSNDSTKLISQMTPGVVFTHDGAAYLKIASNGLVRAVYLKDCSEALKEIGMVETPEGSRFFTAEFGADTYGRVVAKASLKIEL